MKNQFNFLIVVLIATSFTASCVKKAKPVEKAKAQEFVNSTSLEAKQVNGSSYDVMIPSITIKTISLANEPIKSTCKLISNLSEDIPELNAEKEHLMKLIADPATYDSVYESEVAALSEEIELKSSTQEELKSSTLTVKVAYPKKDLLQKLAQLRKENSGFILSIKSPDTVKISAQAKSQELASQTVTLTNKITSGQFDESESNVEMSLDINYDVLCSAEKTQSENDAQSTIDLTFINE